MNGSEKVNRDLLVISVTILELWDMKLQVKNVN